MTTVVTSWSVSGWAEYGQHFLRTFSQRWPSNHNLVIYTEGQRIFSGRPFVRNLLRVEGCAAFLERHANDLRIHGRAEAPGWRAKDRQEGYSYRHDAYKFARKVFALRDAAQIATRNGETLLVWIDADVVTTRDVPDDLMMRLLGHGDVAYLGREGTHSECGFLAFRLPEALPLIERWWDFYASDSFIEQAEWHDSYIFDRARERSPDVRQRNLTPGGWGAVWGRSPLAPYADHRKGLRKREPLPS